jgi:hypothetical protein
MQPIVYTSFNFASFPQFLELTLNTDNAYTEAETVDEASALLRP